MNQPYGWAISHAPADAAAATITKAAVAGKTHIATGISVGLEGGANTAAIVFVLRDSTTGAGNILWQDRLCNIANESNHIQFNCLIPGVIGQAMTLETTAVTGASSSAVVNLTGYTE